MSTLYDIRSGTLVKSTLYTNGVHLKDALIFNPLSLFGGGKQGVWYDPSDKSTLFQDAAGTVPVNKDGDPIGLMRDKSGNGNHMTQPMSASRPIYREFGGYRWLKFDGIDDFMLSDATRIVTPVTQVIGFRVSTTQSLDYGSIQGTGMLSEAEGYGVYVNKLNSSIISSLRLNDTQLSSISRALPDGAVVAYSVFTDSEIESSVNNMVFTSIAHSLGFVNSNVGMTIGARIRPNSLVGFYAKMDYYGGVVVARDLIPNVELLSYMAGKTGVTL